MKRLILALSALCMVPVTGSLNAEDEKKTHEELISLAIQATDNLAHKRYQSLIDAFDEKMREALPGAKLETTWKALLAQAGEFSSVKDAQAQTKGVYTIVYLLAVFTKTDVTIRLVYNTERQIAGLSIQPAAMFPAGAYAPPAYVETQSFTERDVTVGRGEWSLPGALTLPQKKGRLPAVVLVHGSGPNDRDETIGPNRPFKDLAWGLASRGIAVLRYDKRTLAYGKQMAAQTAGITVKEETIDDARAAVTLLRGRPEVDPRRIFIVGHSLGGMLAPRLAAGHPEIAGIVIMAGSARPLEDLVVEQSAYLAGLDKSISDQERQALDTIQRQAARVKDPALSPDTPPAELPLGLPASYWLDLRAHPVTADAARVTQPVLVLQGGRDYQVTREDFDLWKKLFSSKKNCVFKWYPELSHLFIAGHGTPSPDDYAQAGHVDETVVSDIASWIMAVSF